ncbi:radical SAM protein [soil metagenome]
MDVQTDLGVTRLTFADGLLIELLAALERTAKGGLVALTAPSAIADDLERWCRLTENALVDATPMSEGTRFVVRHGPAPKEESRPLGERLWIYANFDCNLRCDYCCVRSSPEAPRRDLGLDAYRRIALESPPLGVREFFVTGGEPMLLPYIRDALAELARVRPTTVLTNGMLLKGERLASLAPLAKLPLTFQISLDSPTAELHDLHRGRGSWERARRGANAIRDAGFRVRLAATVSSDDDEAAFRRFLDSENVAEEDRLVRRIALRGFAEGGIALSRADLVPEITLSDRGVHWHPVGADDADLFVTDQIFPLAHAFAAARAAAEREMAFGARLTSVFHCA